ncbi:MAG: hypothetical protein H6719_22320 [Sandaracinaceae bacterium]|nr:hypothetical protein [Sandaracinaceae bacterium]
MTSLVQTGDIAALVAIAGGAATVVGVLGALLTSWLRQRDPVPDEPSWKGVIGVVAVPIPAGGVGKIAHHRRGARAAVAARMHDEPTGAPVGTRVVVIEVRDGVALVAPMD